MKRHGYTLRAIVATAAVALTFALGVTPAHAATTEQDDASVQVTGERVASISNGDVTTYYGSVQDAFSAVPIDGTETTVELLMDTYQDPYEHKNSLGYCDYGNLLVLGTSWDNDKTKESDQLKPGDSGFRGYWGNPALLTVTAGQKVVLNLNGHSVSMGRSRTNGVGKFVVQGDLTVNGVGSLVSLMSVSADASLTLNNATLSTPDNIIQKDYEDALASGDAFAGEERGELLAVSGSVIINGSTLTRGFDHPMGTLGLASVSDNGVLSASSGVFQASAQDECVFRVGNTGERKNPQLNLAPAAGSTVSVSGAPKAIVTGEYKMGKKGASSVTITDGVTIEAETAIQSGSRRGKIDISGGVINGALTVGNGVSKTNEHFSVSGGSFDRAVPQEFIADQNLTSIKDATEYFHLGNISDELEVKSFEKSEDGKTVFVAPEVDGKAFAGWYADSSFSTPVSKDGLASTEKAYAKFVTAYTSNDSASHDGVINFMGGALRYGAYKNEEGTALVYDKTDLRFGYNFSVPEGCSLIACGWNYGLSDALGKSIEGSKRVDVSADMGDIYPDWVKSGSGFVSNIVISPLASSRYSDDVYVQPYLTYETPDGTTVTVKGGTATRTVKAVAEGISNSSSESDVTKAYAKGILDVIGEQGSDGFVPGEIG